MTVAIQEQIKVLVELQKLDGEIFRLKKELAAHPGLEKKNQADFERKKEALKKAEADFKALQLQQKGKEGELAVREEKITKLQGQLYQLKTNKEYAAMELEIKGLKADKSLLEEEILRLLDDVEASKQKAAGEKALLGEEEKSFKAASESLKAREAEIQSSVSSLEEKRKAHLPHIEAKLLSQYEKVLKSREGLALVPVRNNSCGGCHMGLPPQVVNEIQMQDKMIVCESCARILYWQS